MITSIMIILIVLFQFRTFIFASERYNLYEDIFHKQKNKEPYTTKEMKMLVYVVFKLFFGIIYLVFLIYGLFTELFLYCLLTLIMSVVSFMLMRLASKPESPVGNRILVARIDSIVKMLIWLTPLLEIIKNIF